MACGRYIRKKIGWNTRGISGTTEHISKTVTNTKCTHVVGKGCVNRFEEDFICVGIGAGGVVEETESIHPASAGISIWPNTNLVFSRSGIGAGDAEAGI